METKQIFQKHALTYGALAGLASILLSFVVYSMDAYIEKPLWSTLLITLIGFGITFYAIFSFRKETGGYLKLGQAMKLGVAVAFIMGLITAISNWFFMTYLEPDLVNQMLEISREQLEKQEMLDEEQIEQALIMSEKFMKPTVTIPLGIISSVFMGVIYSLISGLALQKKDPSEYYNQ